MSDQIEGLLNKIRRLERDNLALREKLAEAAATCERLRDENASTNRAREALQKELMESKGRIDAYAPNAEINRPKGHMSF